MCLGPAGCCNTCPAAALKPSGGGLASNQATSPAGVIVSQNFAHSPSSVPASRTGRHVDRPPLRRYQWCGALSAAQSRKVERSRAAPLRASCGALLRLGSCPTARGRGARENPIIPGESGAGLPSSRTASSDGGTRCSLPALMRSGGIVRAFARPGRFLPMLRRASPERAAVRIRNSSARAACRRAGEDREQNAPKPSRVTASWCSTFATLPGAGGILSRCPFSGPDSRPCETHTVAQSSTDGCARADVFSVSVLVVRSAQGISGHGADECLPPSLPTTGRRKPRGCLSIYAMLGVLPLRRLRGDELAGRVLEVHGSTARGR